MNLQLKAPSSKILCKLLGHHYKVQYRKRDAHQEYFLIYHDQVEICTRCGHKNVIWENHYWTTRFVDPSVSTCSLCGQTRSNARKFRGELARA